MLTDGTMLLLDPVLTDGTMLLLDPVLTDGTMLLPEPMLIYRQLGSIALARRKFHGRC